MKDLAYTYRQAQEPAVRGLSFEIDAGEVFGFLGPSGAGKSTTQKVLIRLLKDYQGVIEVFERDLRQWGADYFESIGVSFEFPNHYLKLTARENLDYFASLYEADCRPADELLEWVGLKEDADQRVAQFSKGMKNRLSVARCLLHDPPLLFLDEPTAGLDPVNARRVTELIREQQQAGKTVFLTTHDMVVAEELCDRVAFLVDGEIPLVDAPDSLKLQHGRRRVKVEYREQESVRAAEFDLEGLGSNAEFLAVLRDHEVRTIHTQEASLADVFIAVTGRGLA